MSEFELSSVSMTGSLAAVVEGSGDVEARLRLLHPDLSPSLFHDAILSGLRDRNESNIKAAATIASGVQQWLGTVKALRTLLAIKKWHIHDQQNCPFITSPDRSVSIVVMTGSSDTGKKGAENPVNQAEKGAVMARIVEDNRQLELFNQTSLELLRSGQGKSQVWVLLYHYDKGLNEVRFELSLPTGFKKRKITAWGEQRIVFSRIPNGSNDVEILKEEPNTPPVVEVEPKPGKL